MPMPTVRTEDGVFFSKVRKNACRDRFLADIRVARSVDQSTLMGLRQPIFALANNLHRSIEPEERFFVNRCCCHFDFISQSS